MQKNIRDCLIFLAVFTLPLFSSCGSVKISGVDLDSVRKVFFSGNYEIAESADFAEVSKAGKKYSWLPYVFYLGLSDKNSRRAEFYLSEAMENSPYPLNVTAYSILIKRLDSPFWEKALEFGGKFNRQEYREYFPYTRPEYTEALKAYSDFKEGKFKSAEKLLNQNLYELKGFSGFYQEKDSEYVQEEFYILRDGVYLISLFNQYSSGLGEPGTDLSGLQKLCSDSGFLDNLRLFFLMYPANSQWYTLTLDAFSSFYEKVKEVFPSFFPSVRFFRIFCAIMDADPVRLSHLRRCSFLHKGVENCIRIWYNLYIILVKADFLLCKDLKRFAPASWISCADASLRPSSTFGSAI